MVILYTLAAFALGAIPFSVLVGRLALGQDIRRVGDGNPGATNVVKAGGLKWGIVAFLGDYLKGVLPAALAWFFSEIRDWRVVPIALAPVLGHAFSPLLNFRGGKALAATFGMWSGLTLAEVPTMLGLLMIMMYSLIDVDGWAVSLALLPIGAYTAFQYESAPLTAIWAGNLLLILYKHRADLRQRPRLRGWLTRRT